MDAVRLGGQLGSKGGWGPRAGTYKETGKNWEIPPKIMMTATTRLTIRLQCADTS